MSALKEFKDFAMRGNVVDLAIGVVIGGAFGLVVTSMVNDIIMPPIGYMLGGTDFTSLKMVIQEASITDGVAKEAVSINYGSFIQTIINFLIIAAVIFMVVKGMNKMKSKKEEAPKVDPGPTFDQKLLMEIRDALKK